MSQTPAIPDTPYNLIPKRRILEVMQNDFFQRMGIMPYVREARRMGSVNNGPPVAQREVIARYKIFEACINECMPVDDVLKYTSLRCEANDFPDVTAYGLRLAVLGCGTFRKGLSNDISYQPCHEARLNRQGARYTQQEVREEIVTLRDHPELFLGVYYARQFFHEYVQIQSQAFSMLQKQLGTIPTEVEPGIHNVFESWDQVTLMKHVTRAVYICAVSNGEQIQEGKHFVPSGKSTSESMQFLQKTGAFRSSKSYPNGKKLKFRCPAEKFLCETLGERGMLHTACNALAKGQKQEKIAADLLATKTDLQGLQIKGITVDM